MAHQSIPNGIASRGLFPRYALTASIGAAVAVLTLPLWNNNFHTIKQGVAYRSAQPSATDIAAYKGRFGIASIINLRGANPDKAWYRDELRVASEQHIRHYDFEMSASKVLSGKQITDLILLMKAAPKPVLIHCRSGSDRTGLAASLFEAAVDNSSEADAEAQLSIWYGHYSVPFLGAYAMNLSWERIEPWFGFVKSTAFAAQ